MNVSRRTLFQSSAAVAALAALPACARREDEVNASDLLAQTTDQILETYPETASSFGIDTGARQILKSKLSDRSPSGVENAKRSFRDTLAQLQKVDTDALEPDEALNIDVVRTVFERTSEGFDFPYGDVALLNTNWSWRNAPYVVAQNTGAFVEIPTFLDGSHLIESAEDADAYLLRMEAYAAQLDGETDRVLSDGDQGVILPDFLMTKTLGALRGARDKPSEEWGIVTSLASRTATIDEAYEGHGRAVAESKIRPALERQIAALEALAPQTNDNAGVWDLPDGEAYYAWALQAGTTTTMSPNEVHEMGLDELASLHGRMDPILRSIGYTQGPVGERMTALAKDPRFLFAEGDPGRAEIMAFIEEKVAEIRGLMPQAFETLVPGFLEVTRIPPEVEAGAPGAYGGAGSIDGKQPGHFWINLRNTALHNRFNLADLTYHESIPGHVWQGEYTFKQPLVRSLLAFNAYSEGWALYAQQLADELGVYDDFPAGRLGYLQGLAFRACRLVVDTGLHAKQWKREQAIDWFVTNNGSSYDEVQGEIDRYCAWPGQACGYKVGHSAINRLRDNAKAELGDQFDFRRFNDALVLGGSVPMSVLTRVIDDYIAKEKTG